MKRLRAFILLVWLALFGFRIEAHVFIVTDASDSTDITSLRGAIIAANQLGGHNTIRFGAPFGEGKTKLTVYHLTISGALEDHAQTGDLDIERGTLTIDGLRQNITIDATGLGDRIFRVHPGTRLLLAHLTLTGGYAPNAALSTSIERAIGNGGAIYNAGVLNVQNCVFTNNVSGDGAPDSGIPQSNPGGDGGAIYNSSNAVFLHCTIAENNCGIANAGSVGGQGGGIRNDGTCVLTHCNITGNASGMGGSTVGSFFGSTGGFSGSGGGLYNSGIMRLSKCIVSGNRCPKAADGVTPDGANGSGSYGGYGGNGGGILNAGQLRIHASAIYGNRAGNGGDSGGGTYGAEGGAGGEGGAILNQGLLTADDCTISGNACGDGGKGGPGSGSPGAGGSGGNGGGIFNLGTATFTACTIVLNKTGNGGDGGDATTATNSFGRQTLPGIGGWAGNGGGIYVLIEGVTVRSTLIGLNTTGISAPGGYGGLGTDGYGPITSGGFNLIGIDFGGGTDADIVGTADSPVDPLIGPLHRNGGPTPTHALLASSPAIDQGKNFNSTKDQRGQRRRLDIPTIPNAPGGDGTDIGAFEANPVQSN
jgi:hypothetical protein